MIVARFLWRVFLSFSQLFWHCKQASSVYIVQLKYKLDAFGFGYKRLWAVAKVYGFIELLMGPHERRRHGVGIV